MTNQERFHWFDVYLESIEGLSPSIKKPISQLARCVFEAETGIDVSNAPVDVADLLGIQNVIDTISDSIDNKKPLPKDIVQQINDLTYAIDKLQDSNDLKNLDTSAAKAAINTFANTKPMIDSLNRELADLKRQYSGLNRNMDPQKLKELSEQVATINNTKRMLDAIGKPYDQLKSHLDMLDQAINNAKHDERNLNYRQHEFDQFVKNKAIDDQRMAIKRQAARDNASQEKAASANAEKDINTSATPKTDISKLFTKPEEKLSPQEQALVDMKTAITDAVSANGSASISEFLPSIDEFLTNVKNCSTGHYADMDNLDQQGQAIKTQLATFIDTCKKYLGDQDFQDVLHNVTTEQLRNSITEHGIDLNEADEINEELGEINGQIDSLNQSIAGRMGRLNAMKRAAHINEFKDGVNADEFATENENLLNAIQEDKDSLRQYQVETTNLNNILHAFDTIKVIMSGCDWLDNVAHPTIKKFQDKREADRNNYLSSLKTTPETFVTDLQDRLNAIITATAAQSDNIRNMYKAIIGQNRDANLGTKTTVKRKIQEWGLKVDTSLFVTDKNTGNFMYSGEGVNIPIRIAYEMATNGVTLSGNGNTVDLNEHASIKNGEAFSEHWKIQFTQTEATKSSADGVSISASFDSATNQETVLMTRASIDDIIQNAFYQVLKLLPNVKQI